MRNRFKLTESEKNRIRGLHNINPIYEQFIGNLNTPAGGGGGLWPSGAKESFNIDKLTDEEGMETVTLSRKDDVINDEGCYQCLLKHPKVIKMIEDGLQLTLAPGTCACFRTREDGIDCQTYDECCSDESCLESVG